MKKIFTMLSVVLSVALLFASQASAAIDLTGITFPITDVESVAALLLVAAAGIWVIQKVMGLIRRG